MPKSECIAPDAIMFLVGWTWKVHELCIRTLRWTLLTAIAKTTSKGISNQTIFTRTLITRNTYLYVLQAVVQHSWSGDPTDKSYDLLNRLLPNFFRKARLENKRQWPINHFYVLCTFWRIWKFDSPTSGQSNRGWSRECIESLERKRRESRDHEIAVQRSSSGIARTLYPIFVWKER